jgi:A/G-specific adenine glycosylase
MLQQTQATTVVPYYASFLKRFPTVEALARANESDVLHAWQGLGYYRRARNLHRAARQIVAEHGGRLPADAEALRALPGLGRYSANAVACFAFGRRLPIVEANTRRVWARLAAASGPAESELWRLAERALPGRRADDFNQALMDLGAQVCLPKRPQCGGCPVRPFCEAHRQGAPENFPKRKRKERPVPVDHVCVAIWRRAGGPSLLVVRRPDGERWGGLWELPRVERGPGEDWSAAALRAIGQAGAAGAELGPLLRTIRHGVTRYRVQLRCYEARLRGAAAGPRNSADRKWMRLEDLPNLPFSSPQRSLVAWLSARAGAAWPTDAARPARRAGARRQAAT